MTSNKHVDLRKIENFVRNKYCPEDISKDKGKRANFRKSFKNFIVDGYLTCKGKSRVIFDNDRKFFNTTTLFYRNPILITTFELQSKPFKYFNITIPYSFWYTRRFGEYLFPKGVLVYREKTTPWSIYFLENYDWGVDISLA